MTMMLQVLGVLVLMIAAAGFIFYMRTSYVTQGGSQGQVPCVAAAAVQVPLLTMGGLSLLDKATMRLDWSWWQWLATWLAETVLVAAAAIWIGNVARRKGGAGPVSVPAPGLSPRTGASASAPGQAHLLQGKRKLVRPMKADSQRHRRKSARSAGGVHPGGLIGR